MNLEKHLSRNELIRIAQAGTGPTHPHLIKCAECRAGYDVLAKYSGIAGREPLPPPPPHLMQKAKKLAHPAGPVARLAELVAELVFDSWAAPTPAGVRGPMIENNRRLHFRVHDLLFEVRAEKRESGWSFVAQCSGAPEGFVLQTGEEIVHPDSLGVYQWKAAKPPAHLTLHAVTTRIVIPRLSWKRTKTN